MLRCPDLMLESIVSMNELVSLAQVQISSWSLKI
jgi:hypothetical protein